MCPVKGNGLSCCGIIERMHAVQSFSDKTCVCSALSRLFVNWSTSDKLRFAPTPAKPPCKSTRQLLFPHMQMVMMIAGMSRRLCSPCAESICRAPWSKSSRTSASLLRRMSLSMALLLCRRAMMVREFDRQCTGKSPQTLCGVVTGVAARRRARPLGMILRALRFLIALPLTVPWNPTGLGA